MHSHARIFSIITIAVLSFAASAFGATITVTNANDSGAGSLRQAITTAATTARPVTIAFAIGSGPQRIPVLTVLPAIVEGVTVDGATAPQGPVGAPRIVVVNADQTVATLTNAFRYQSPFDPNGCTRVRGRAVRR